MDKRSRSIIELILIVIFVVGTLLFFIGYANGQTQCEHDQNQVGYWDNYRISPGRVRHVDQNEIVVGLSDKKQVRVLTLYWDKTTTPAKAPIVKLDYMFGYCIHCHHLFIYERIK